MTSQSLKKSGEEFSRDARINSWHRTAKFFQNFDLEWLYRDICIRQKNDDPEFLMGEIKHSIHDIFFTEIFNGANDDYTFQEIQYKAAEYVSSPDFHCTILRNFFLKRFINHIKHQNIITNKESLWAGASVFALVLSLKYFLSFGWIVFVTVVPALFIKIPKMWRSIRTDKILNQLSHEINGETFDEQISIDRLKTIEKIGVMVPSLMYALLRQPKRKIGDDVFPKWEKLNENEQVEIKNHYRNFIDKMASYTEEEPAKAA